MKNVLPNPLTHPQHLSTMGALLGLEMPEKMGCRVLELNCGDGGNLIPMALRMPECEFIGLDTETQGIDSAQALVQELGIENIQFRKFDLDDVLALDGKFDFILVNRLYSWIQPELQENLLRSCKEKLSKNGLIYLNLNILPGWSELLSFREIMRLISADCKTEDEKQQRIVRYFQTANSMLAPQKDIEVYKEFHAETAQMLIEQMKRLDYWVFRQDYLDEHNYPVYLSEFEEVYSACGLKLLSGAEISDSSMNQLPDEVVQLLGRKSNNQIELEQYIDYFVNRAYREVILCHSGTLQRKEQTFQTLKNYSLRANFDIQSAEKLFDEEEAIEIISQSGKGVKLKGTLIKQALLNLKSEYPDWVKLESLAELLDKNNPELQFNEQSLNELAGVLLTLFINTGLVQFSYWSVPGSLAAKGQIHVDPLVALQAERFEFISGGAHESVWLNSIERIIINELHELLDLQDFLEKLKTMIEIGRFDLDSLNELYGSENEDHSIEIFNGLMQKGLLR